MADKQVDEVSYVYDKVNSKLIVWLFNDDSKYNAKALKLAAKYPFGRKPDNEDGTLGDRKQKLLIGLYRIPFRDGWKYILNTKIHPHMRRTVLRYIHYGFRRNEKGEKEPFTYLRHNRKALGIYYLFERYVEFCIREKEWFKEMCKEDDDEDWSDFDYKQEFPDHYDEPYFPTPESYTGVNIATRWDKGE